MRGSLQCAEVRDASAIIKHLHLLRAGGLIENSDIGREWGVPFIGTGSRGNYIKIFHLYNLAEPLVLWLILIKCDSDSSQNCPKAPYHL